MVNYTQLLKQPAYTNAEPCVMINFDHKPNNRIVNRPVRQ